jgi:hypothetical protein
MPARAGELRVNQISALRGPGLTAVVGQFSSLFWIPYQPKVHPRLNAGYFSGVRTQTPKRLATGQLNKPSLSTHRVSSSMIVLSAPVNKGPIISHASEIVESFFACLNPIHRMAALLSPTFCVF